MVSTARLSRGLGVLVWASCAAAPFLAPAEAHASGSWIPTETTRVPVGLNLGAAGGQGQGLGMLLGGEASVVHWTDGLWFGGYVDMLHDFARRSSRLSVGGEVGYWFAGVDAGFVHDFAGDASGFRVRGLASIALVTVYAGGGNLYGGGGATGFTEIGVLLKWALFERADGSGWRLGIP